MLANPVWLANSMLANAYVWYIGQTALNTHQTKVLANMLLASQTRLANMPQAFPGGLANML
jgi:hypothetical protein